VSSVLRPGALGCCMQAAGHVLRATKVQEGEGGALRDVGEVERLEGGVAVAQGCTLARPLPCWHEDPAPPSLL